jgi:malate dehydrogenase (oxaloacetate-decarboxylating)(NADP+)
LPPSRNGRQAVLFKKFAESTSSTIEIKEQDPQKLVDIIASLEPTFGGINLEDIKRRNASSSSASCARRMNIPGLSRRSAWDRNHVCAAILNGLQGVGKEFRQ